MKYLSIYLLLQLGGNAEPTKEDVSKILAEQGIEVEDEPIDRFFAGIKGKDVDELVALGKTKLSGGGGGGGGGGGAGPAAADGAAPAAEEKVEEEEEEIDMGGGMGMFDGDEGGGGGDY
mmetsp:Transcript_10260/g.12448  ORF Transcript_10260/g.12448 Transcript_10260/m.12448 type:complete len:119 (+) Transcript_10260:58-414(+)|eukprot:CAMPEP_0114352714 /NCGR_PEP_ID=MMETSP0101-20121206/18139_1 /TAXON_ID=38822 ORGANISM="Pteridomonas danica, Strain PT" /NCGR_SAMPLE_ID=MMETSP0101 /ASSEMBLY_ACC=CAM_ASM_000211 /LENGTH=118 /DNA_ID=CAMNT_0001493225 /DNA_START=69 /DNA_END=425 /DNA_ORIENTATION=-